MAKSTKSSGGIWGRLCDPVQYQNQTKHGALCCTAHLKGWGSARDHGQAAAGAENSHQCWPKGNTHKILFERNPIVFHPVHSPAPQLQGLGADGLYVQAVVPGSWWDTDCNARARLCVPLRLHGTAPGAGENSVLLFFTNMFSTQHQ